MLLFSRPLVHPYAGSHTGNQITPYYDPLLPGLARSWEFELHDEFEQIPLSNLKLFWSVYADNAPPVGREVILSEIQIVEHNRV